MKKSVLLLSVVGLFALGSCKKKGCTDPTAVNYDSEAEKMMEVVKIFKFLQLMFLQMLTVTLQFLTGDKLQEWICYLK